MNKQIRNPQSAIRDPQFLWSLLLLLKLALVFSLPKISYPDEAVYTGFAQRLLASHSYINFAGHPSAGFVPGYPLFLAAFFKVLGNSAHLANIIIIVQTFLSLAIALAYGGLLALLTGRPRLARACAIVIFFFPPYINYCAHLVTEIPYSACLALAILFWERTRQDPHRLGSWAGLGLFHALSFMIRPVTFLLTPILLLWPLVEIFFNPRADRTEKKDTTDTTHETYKSYPSYPSYPSHLSHPSHPSYRSLAGAFLSGALILLVWLPWVIRNERTLHAFIPLTTGSGGALYSGSVADWTVADKEITALLQQHGIARAVDNEIEANRVVTAVAKANIRRAPLLYARLTLDRTWRFWLSEYPTYFFPRPGSQYRAEHNYFAVAGRLALHALNALLVLAMIAAACVLCTQRRWWPYILLLIYFTLIHAMLITTARYSVPVTGLAIVLIFGAADKIAATKMQ